VSGPRDTQPGDGRRHCRIWLLWLILLLTGLKWLFFTSSLRYPMPPQDCNPARDDAATAILCLGVVLTVFVGALHVASERGSIPRRPWQTASIVLAVIVALAALVIPPSMPSPPRQTGDSVCDERVYSAQRRSSSIVLSARGGEERDR
jgi:hypothetical protein